MSGGTLIPNLQPLASTSQALRSKYTLAAPSIAALHELVARVLPPIIAFALARGMVRLVGWWIGVDAAPEVWITWDSEIYRWIAQRGYTLLAAPGKPSGLDGSVGWFRSMPG